MEIIAELKGDGVYLSGEVLKCVITFRNTGRRKLEALAWSSVQIQSLCQISDGAASKRRPSESEAMGSIGPPATSLQCSSNDDITTTTPKILFCDLSLGRAECQRFCYEETLPKLAQSSHQGRCIRISHRLVVATQRVNCPIAVLSVPFRVIGVGEDTRIDPTVDEAEADADEESNAPHFTNPFFYADKETDKSPCLPEPANPRRMATFYDIRSAKGRVGKLCLFKSCYRLGEEISGLFDFQESTVPCMQYLVTLLCQEKVLTQTSAASGSSSALSKLSTKQSSQEFCFGYEQSNFSLSVPLHATPSFSQMCAKFTWSLKFEFVICSEEDVIWQQPLITCDENSPDEASSLGHEWNAPPSVPVETMTWTLPVTILPAHPKLIAHAASLPTKFSMMV